MQKRIFTYLAIGGIYILALFTRFGEIVNLTIGYTFAIFVFSLFILFLVFYVPKKKTISFDISIILLIVALVIAILTSAYKYLSIANTYEFISAILISIIVINLVETKEDFNLFLRGIVGLGLLLSGISYLFYYAVEFHLFPKIALYATRYAFVYHDVISSLWEYQNSFGAFLVLPLLISFGFLLSSEDIAKKTLWFICSIFLAFVLILTASRGAFIVEIFALILFALLSHKKDIPKVLFYIVAVTSASFLLTQTAASPSTIRIFLGKSDTLVKYVVAGTPNTSLGARVYFAKFSLKSFLQHPLFGTGLRSYKNVYSINNLIPDKISTSPHSMILRFLVETGAIGITAFLFFVFRFLKKGFYIVKNEKNDFIAKGLFAGAVGMFLHMCIDVDSLYLIMMVLLFVSLSLFAYKEKGRKYNISKTLICIVSIILILSVAYLVPKGIASVYGLKGNVELQNGNMDSALVNYKTAEKYDYSNAYYHYIIGNVYREMGFDKEATEEYEKAASLHPTDYRYPLSIGTVYLDTKNPLSIEYLNKAIALYPSKTELRGLLAIAYIYVENDKNRAEFYINEAFSMNENTSNANIAKGLCLLKENRDEEAKIYFIRGIKVQYNNPYGQLGLAYYFRKKGDAIGEEQRIEYMKKFDRILTETYLNENGLA